MLPGYLYWQFGLATSVLAESPRSVAALGWSVARLRCANWGLAALSPAQSSRPPRQPRPEPEPAFNNST